MDVTSFRLFALQVYSDVRGDTFSRIARWLPLGVVIVLTLGVFWASASGKAPAHLFKEGRLFTHLSGALLGACGATCLHVAMVMRKNHSELNGLAVFRTAVGLWVFSGVGFIYLWLDEIACYHERMGDVLQVLLPQSFMSERWDSIIIGLYGLGALLVLLIYRQEIWRHWRFASFFGVGFSLFGVMVCIDFLTEDMLIIDSLAGEEGLIGERLFTMLELAEDYAKLLAISFFLRGLLGIRWSALTEGDPVS